MLSTRVHEVDELEQQPHDLLRALPGLVLVIGVL
jgi:hypothetical protein